MIYAICRRRKFNCVKAIQYSDTTRSRFAATSRSWSAGEIVGGGTTGSTRSKPTSIREVALRLEVEVIRLEVGQRLDQLAVEWTGVDVSRQVLDVRR